MSDSTLQSSSPSSSSSASSGIAFLVHSQATMHSQAPFVIDDKPLARQKRRRTSKEDEDVLRAEYLKNPKPDKTARMQIVAKVALSAKEVQIWFQNKRQSQRRKDPSSTTLMSSSSAMSDPAIEDDANVRENELPDEVEKAKEAVKDAAEEEVDEVPMSKPEDLEPATTSDDTLEGPSATETTESTNPDAQDTIESTAALDTDPPTADTAATAATAATELSSSQQTLSSSQNASQPRTSWISNRRSASFMRSNDDYASETISFPTMSVPTSTAESASTPRNLKRSRSFVRLSMTDDGTARVITDADKTPSPPHAKSNPATLSRAAAGLRRSFSAAAFNERLVAASHGEPSPKVPRTSSIGRSKDSRAWEFWCDPETRYSTSLTTRAEQEGSGSAADAIGLLRANRRVLAPNQTRSNTPMLLRNASAKDAGVKKSRGPMKRASTTYGRLQTKEGKFPKRTDSESSDDLPATESDKENWEPEIPSAQRVNNARPTTASYQHPRQILGENTDIMSQSTSLGALLARERKDSLGKRSRESDEDPEEDEELRSFMAGGGLSTRTSLNSEEEAGCVEGLLKLSQGNWK